MLTYSYTVQTDIPGLFQYPLRFINRNSDHKKNEEDREGNETIKNLLIFFKH